MMKKKTKMAHIQMEKMKRKLMNPRSTKKKKTNQKNLPNHKFQISI